MHLNQDPTRIVARRASSSELNRWRREQVAPELLPRPLSHDQAHTSTSQHVGDFTLKLAAQDEAYDPTAVQRSFGENIEL